MITVVGFHNLLMYRNLTKYNVVSDHCLTDSDNRLITDVPNLDQILSTPSHISLSGVIWLMVSTPVIVRAKKQGSLSLADKFLGNIT
jgi:hypothetical protein